MSEIRVTATLAIPEHSLEYRFIRASGPGGQNVNKVSSAVQLRFDSRAAGLPAELNARLRQLAGRRMSLDGVVVIDARNHRTQERNREEALVRLLELLNRATRRPKPRKPTRPTLASRERRLEGKRKAGDKKRLRSRPVD